MAASLALSRVPLFAQPMPANVPPAAILADEKERDSREKLGEIVAALGVGPWSAVADIGTGYGYYAVRIARVVSASGRVYAQEIDERLVKKLGRRVQAEKLTNVEPVLGMLPACLSPRSTRSCLRTSTMRSTTRRRCCGA